ncbi:MAG: DapH/DapD/GlmU-related protein [Bacteroidota bacterium]
MERDNQTPVLIVGTEAAGRMAMDIAHDLDVLVFGFLTEEKEDVNKEINDILIVAELGTKDSDTLLADPKVQVVIADSSPTNRKDYLRQIGDKEAKITSFVHPMNAISPHSKIGMGNLVGAGFVVNANSAVGNMNLIGNYVSIGADSEVGDYTTIQDGVRIGQEVVIEDEAFIGMGAIIHASVKIGAKSSVAAGSVVLQDVPADTSVFGNPAKPL